MAGGPEHPPGPATWDDGSLPSPASGADLGLESRPRRPTSSSDEGTPRTFQHPEEERYEVHGELGRGGMGRVVSVRDQRLGREVALKQLREGRDPRRMAREARITARLEHPGIVPIYDAGTDPEGRPYYTMRLLRGRSLAEVLAEAPDQEARLLLVRRVLDATQAVAFAHSRGVVHRDLKPANIMLGAFGETQVVDWGLARLDGDELDPSDAGRTTMAAGVTHEGAVLGTPAYMSPEQAQGQRGDERSDVWSLGVVLHELVTGAPPFTGGSGEDVLQRLRLSTVPRLTEPPELAAIVNRALQRDPESRYPDAEALAEDLSAWLDGRRVEAYSYSGVELLGRLLRAWRVPLAVAALALLLVGAVVAAAVQQTARERDRALEAEARSRTAEAQAEHALARALLAQAHAAQGEGARAQAEVLAAAALRLRESPEARGLLSSFGVQERPRLLSSTPLPSCAGTWVGPRAEWLLCQEAGELRWLSGSPLTERWTQTLGAARVDVAEGGEVIWAVEGDGARRMRTTDMSLLGSTLRGVDEWILDASPDGEALWLHSSYNTARYVATDMERAVEVEVCPPDLPHPVFADTADGLHVVLCQTGEAVVHRGLEELRRVYVDTLDVDTGSSAVAPLPGGLRAVVGTLSGRVLLVDLQTGAVLREEQPDLGIIHDLRLSPDGRVVVVRGERDTLLLWDLATGAVQGRLPYGGRGAVRFVDDHTLAVVHDRLELWRLPAEPRPYSFHGGSGTTSAVLHPGGELLASTHGLGELNVWEVASGRRLHRLRWGEGVLKDGAFSPDGARYAVVGLGIEGVALLDTETWQEVEPVLRKGRWLGRRVGFLPRGDLLSLGFGPSALVRSLDGEQRIHAIGESWDLDRAAQTGTIYVSTESGVRAMDGVADRLIFPEQRGFVAASPDGSLLALTHDRSVEVRDLEGTLLHELPVTSGRVFDLAFSPDGRWLAAGDLSGTVHVWSREDMSLAGRLRGHTARVASLSFSADSQTLVTGSWDETARLWDLSVLDADPDALIAQVQGAWGLGLDDVLGTEP